MMCMLSTHRRVWSRALGHRCEGFPVCMHISVRHSKFGFRSIVLLILLCSARAIEWELQKCCNNCHDEHISIEAIEATTCETYASEAEAHSYNHPHSSIITAFIASLQYRAHSLWLSRLTHFLVHECMPSNEAIQHASSHPSCTAP